MPLKYTIMKKIFCAYLFIVIACLALSITGYTQSLPGKGLFENDKPLEITLSGNLKELMNDRAEESKYHPIAVSYMAENNSEISINAEAKTRGHFRKLKGNCLYPPLLIHFTKSDTLSHSVFEKQDKIKLVMPCQGDDYVVREWLVYKLYNIVTPNSFRARLVKVILKNTKTGKAESSFYGILLEEENQAAHRNGLVSITKKLRPEQTEQGAFLMTAVFEYLIGNTDWSVQYMQNIKFFAVDSTVVPTAVAYDFDHAGLVDAPYARPAEELEMSSTRERRYRGYCMTDMKVFDPVVTFYNQVKKDIYAVYTDCTLIDEKYKKATVKFLDEFYATINNPAKLKKEFEYPCDKNGTGNVIIGGMKVQTEK